MLDRTVWDIDPQLATQYRTRAPSLSRQHSVIPSFLAVNLCCHTSYIYRRALLPPAAAHRGDKLQPKGRLPPMNVCTSTCICLKCLSMFIHLSHSDNSGMYIYPCFCLHPGINALHYPNNSAPIYENSLFKRLFSISKKLFNCSTQAYQRKSRCPCQKTRLLLTTRHQRTVSPLQITHWFTSYADVYRDNTATCQKNAFFPQNH